MRVSTELVWTLDLFFRTPLIRSVRSRAQAIYYKIGCDAAKIQSGSLQTKPPTVIDATHQFLTSLISVPLSRRLNKGESHK